jgi:hypothetical protein
LTTSRKSNLTRTSGAMADAGQKVDIVTRRFVGPEWTKSIPEPFWHSQKKCDLLHDFWLEYVFCHDT